MAMRIDGGDDGKWLDTVGIIAVILTGILLFIVLLQPVYRGKEMIAELRSDCDKRGGVMLEYKKMFGTSYECASRLD